MSFIKDMVSKYKDEIVEQIFTDELQKKLVDKLNENINIPFINEKTEEKHLNTIYDVMEDIVKTAIQEKL
jgi:hypothetical protein|tara:strand:+ start:306 stop:515 length:210 start_codon:yes stop_codon:yes gene_type:complete